MLLAKVCLTIVEQDTATPEQEHGAIHELLLDIIGKLKDFG